MAIPPATIALVKTAGQEMGPNQGRAEAGECLQWGGGRIEVGESGSPGSPPVFNQGPAKSVFGGG
jgi:hypothetical protein